MNEENNSAEYIEIALINEETEEEFTTFQLEKSYYSYLLAIAKENNMTFEEYFSHLLDKIISECEESEMEINE